MLNQIFGENIHRLRKEAKISQEELGFRSGYSAEYISRLESGKENPTLEILEVMMALFSCSAEAMLK